MWLCNYITFNITLLNTFSLWLLLSCHNLWYWGSSTIFSGSNLFSSSGFSYVKFFHYGWFHLGHGGGVLMEHWNAPFYHLLKSKMRDLRVETRLAVFVMHYVSYVITPAY